jgi:integrase
MERKTDGQGGGRPIHRLTAAAVASKKAPGLYADGGQLYLRVAEHSKQWIFRFWSPVMLRPRDMGIAPCRTLSLAEARERARAARILLLDGIDPIEHRNAQRAAGVAAQAASKTFDYCVTEYIRDNEAAWSNAKHRREWEQSLRKYISPTLGRLPVSSIDTPQILAVLRPLWARIPESASRIRGRIEQVLGWATVHQYRRGDNPAAWNDLLEHALPAVNGKKHHAALPHAEMPAFFARLTADTSVQSHALRFIVLTAARLSEATEATWDEIDLEERVWTVPAARMKARKEHRVPLCAAAVELLTAMQVVRTGDFVFPGRGDGKPISPATVTRLIEQTVGTSGSTAHGMRACLRTWVSDATAFPGDLAEAALAHALGGSTYRAYQRGDLFARRGELMEAWARFCAGVPAQGKVLPLRKGA